MKPEDKQLLLEHDEVNGRSSTKKPAALQARDLPAGAERQDRVPGPAGDDRRKAAGRPAPAAQGHPAGTRRGRGRQRHVATSGRASRRRRCPNTSRPRWLREVDWLEQMPQASPKYQMVRTYIDWVLKIPWTVVHRRPPRPPWKPGACWMRTTTGSKGQGAHPRVPGGAQAQSDGGPILCFVGPPGVGKTSLGHSIARAMNQVCACRSAACETRPRSRTPAHLYGRCPAGSSRG